MTTDILNDLRSAIEDAMVLREGAAPNDGLAAGLVDTLERIYNEIKDKNFTLEFYDARPIDAAVKAGNDAIDGAANA